MVEMYIVYKAWSQRADKQYIGIAQVRHSTQSLQAMARNRRGKPGSTLDAIFQANDQMFAPLRIVHTKAEALAARRHYRNEPEKTDEK